MIEIIPTVVPSGLEDVQTLLERCESFSNIVHVDAADGVFAPNKTWLPSGNEKLPDAEQFFYEAHLMSSNPEAAGNSFVAAGAKRIIAHVEVLESPEKAERLFDGWKAAGAQEIGIALLIDTPLEALDPYLYMCDSVTLMTIPRVGAQGIPFDPRGFVRVADLHIRYPDLRIGVDGGVGASHIAALVRAGATRFCVGSALAQSTDPAKTHRELLELAKAAV